MAFAKDEGEAQRRESEKALHATRETLRQQAQLLDLAQDAILINDLDNRITFWNPAAAALYGWSREEALGQIAAEAARSLTGARYAAFGVAKPDGAGVISLQEFVTVGMTPQPFCNLPS